MAVAINPGVRWTDARSGDTHVGACDDSAAVVDCIVRFDGFDTVSDWSNVVGTWIVESDTLIQGDSTLGSGDAIITPAPGYASVRIETRAHVLDLTPGLGRAYVAIWSAFAPSAQVAGIQNAGDTITLATDYRFPPNISSTMNRERGGLTLHIDRSLPADVTGQIGLGTHATSAAFDYVLVTTAVPSLPCPAR